MTIRCTTTVCAAKMAAMSAKTTAAVAAAALAAAALTGCSSSAPAPARPSAPAELDPTTCQLDGTADRLRLVCDAATWTSTGGPWQWPDEPGAPHWQVTKSLVVNGEGRVWLSDADRSCVALRALTAAQGETRVLCHLIEADDPAEATAPDPWA